MFRRIYNRFDPMGDVMTIETRIAAIEREIFWNEHVSRETKNKTQRNRCIDRIERFHEELWQLKCEISESDLDRGSIEHSRWYDTGLELR